MTVDLGLTSEQETALKRAVLAGDYHLLLGAGASRDSVASDGSTLPTSAELAERLSTEFKVPIEDGDLLWRIYARAMEEAGEPRVYAWLRTNFWGVNPPVWMDTFARTPWASVWTLNIDDSFEAAYTRVRSDASRPLTTVNWDDEFRLGRDISVVHLHGCVDRDAPRKLVFSLSEYQSVASGAAAWPLNFRDIYGVSPFVIIGARLRDEPDIEAVVANRKPIHNAPTFYVSPRISAAAERDLRRWNLVPVRMTGEAFADVWKELTGLNLDQAPTQQEEITFRVGRQFRELRTDVADRQPSRHNFIGGDEPLWVDIQQNLHAELDWIRQAQADCRQLGTAAPSASAIIYVGRRLTGRSTGLLAIGRELRRQSWRTYIFVGDERPDVDALLRFGANGLAVALLFDSIADIADDIGTLMYRARSAGLNIAIAAVDQVERTASIVGRLEDAYLLHRRIGSINSLLSGTDSRRLVDKLDSIGRLGVLEGERLDRRRVAHFRNHELFDSMAQLENAPGFGRRVGIVVDSITSKTDLEILLIAALTSRVDRRLTSIDAARMMAMESDELLLRIQESDALSALLSADGQWIRARSRWMALDPCVSKLGQQEALDTIGQSLNRVAVRLGRASHRERNPTALLVGSLMRYSNLVELFPSADLESWYESLAPAFGTWSARYWEQRAIMSRQVGRERPEVLAKAESFALRAINIVRDAYSLTTLGTVLLAKAASVPAAEVGRYYDRALDAFQAASDDDPANLVTWLAFLRYSLNILSREQDGLHPLEPELQERINDDWQRISVSISAVANSAESTKRELDWLARQHATISQGNTVD